MSHRPDIEIPHPRGGLRLREVLIGCFYVRVPNLQMAEEASLIIRDFVTLIGPTVSLSYYDNDGEPDDLTPEALDTILNQRLLGPDRYPNADIVLTGQGLYAPEHYLWYNGKALDLRPFDTEASYLWFWVPRQFFLSHEEDVQKFLESCASTLPFSYGYANLGLSGENKQQKQALARRYPGLDIAHPGCVSGDIGDKAAGAYWMNFLGLKLCANLGGVESIRRDLPANFVIRETSAGICEILLGPQPEIGDVNRRDVLPDNRALARYFSDHAVLHVPERVVYFEDADGPADSHEMEEWHTRFLK